MNDKELLHTYFSAIKNEIYIDKLLQETSGLNDIKTPIIKAVKLKKYIDNYKTVFLLLYKIGMGFWPILQFFLNIFHFSKALMVKFFQKQKKIPSDVKSLTVDLTPLLLDRIKLIDEKPEYSIGFNKLQHNFTFLDVLNFKDLIRTFSLSNKAIINFPKNDRAYIMHTYSAFSFFCVFLALNKLDLHEIWYSNHIDRWAVLIDNLNQKKNGSNNKHERKNVLVQHGIEDGSLCPPVKIKSLKKIYLFNQEQYKFFKNKILIDSEIEIKLFNTSLMISPISKEKKSILIVGLFTVFSSYEEGIINILSKRNDIVFYIKPHPTQGISFYDKFSHISNFILIKDKKFFPDVDLVLSYNSTLAYEYQMLNKKVIFYEPSLEQTIKQLQDEILYE